MRFKTLALIVTMAPAAAQAASYNIFDGAAEATVTDRNGVTVWRTDGEADNIFIGNYYLRRAGDERELPLTEFIGAPAATVSDDAVSLAFADDRLSATLETRLEGGTSGSGRSTLTRSLSIANAGAETQSLLLFDYLDLDIRFEQLNQRDQFIQTELGRIITTSAREPFFVDTRVTPTPESWEIGDFFGLYTKFFIDQDGPTTLPNTPALGAAFPVPPGEGAFAFGWAFDLAPGEEFAVSNVSTIAPIPLPAGGWLLVSAIGALGAAAQRRRRA